MDTVDDLPTEQVQCTQFYWHTKGWTAGWRGDVMCCFINPNVFFHSSFEFQTRQIFSGWTKTNISNHCATRPPHHVM